MSRKHIVLLVIFFIFTTAGKPLMAQCAMCKATVESGDSNINVSTLNAGIVYLASFAYILISVVGFIWFRHSSYYIPARKRIFRFFRKFRS